MNNCSHLHNLTMERTFKVASGAESDLTIHCEGCVFHVHRSLLSLASPVWNRMLTGDFAEAASNTIVFEGDCARALRYALEILYYPDMLKTTVRFGCSLKFMVLLGKYELKGVEKLLGLANNMKALENENVNLRAKIRKMGEENGRLKDENEEMSLSVNPFEKRFTDAFSRLFVDEIESDYSLRLPGPRR